MRHSASTPVIILFATLATANVAVAQDARCGGNYTVRSGQETKAYLDTRVGKPCHMTYVTFGSSRGSSGIRITSAPRNGTASASATGFRYAPRPGFRGTDTMTVRFSWNGPPSNKENSGVVVFAIAVE